MGPQTIGASAHHAHDADWHRSQQGVKELFMAIHDGDAASAQRAHALVAKGSGDINGNSPMAQIVAALGTGDLAAAQRLAQSLQMSRELKFNTSGTQVVDFIGNGCPIADYKAGLMRFSGVGSANSKAAKRDF